MTLAAVNLCFVAGDSIGAGSFCKVPWSAMLRHKLGPTWAVANSSYPGQGASTIATNINGYQTNFAAANAPYSGKRIAIFEVGTNNVAVSTGAEIYAMFVAQVNNGASANWDAIIWQRNTPRGGDGSWSSTREGRLLDLWNLIKSYTVPAGSTTKYIAFDTHAVLAANGTGSGHPALRETPVNFKLSALDGTNDGLHPNDNAAEARAAALYEVIQSVVGVYGPAADRSRNNPTGYRGRTASALLGREQPQP